MIRCNRCGRVLLRPAVTQSVLPRHNHPGGTQHFGRTCPIRVGMRCEPMKRIVRRFRERTPRESAQMGLPL